MPKLISVAAIAILLGLTTSAQVNGRLSTALRPTKSRRVAHDLHKFPLRLSRPSQGQQALRRATASASITWVTCPPEAQDLGAMCGILPVPLDRRRPEAKKINIYFEIYLHSNPGPAESAILANDGGPGDTTTGLRAGALFVFGQNLDVHDLLLIDDRGRGFSATIDCGGLQHGTAPFIQAEKDCAAQLGDTANMYATGDIAMDTDAVRAALGYDRVDYWGGSYGGVDVTAYATRFGQHLRSIVLDAAVGTPDLKAFARDRDSARASLRELRLDCLRSVTCSADHPDPEGEFQQLIQAVRNKPVQGHAYDASGNLTEVRVDESALLYMVINLTGQFVNIGELLAAGDALEKDDTGPLLRLGAEETPLVTDHGDPTVFSQGDLLATQCIDARHPWDWSVPVQMRKQQFAAAVDSLTSEYFAPFSKTAATSLGPSMEKLCLWWEKPTPSAPVTPPQPTYPNVPTLVMSGDLDTVIPTEEVRRVAALFPGSTFVPVAEAGHETVYWSQCAANLQSQFIEILQVGDTSCTKTPEIVWPAVGRFPLLAVDARPAAIDPDGSNEIGESERKVVTVALATALDALKRTSIGGGTGFGLREGTFESSLDDNGNQITALVNCAFVKDVTVNGTMVWGADLSFAADLAVSGTGTAGGTIHVEGNWLAPGPAGNFKISGTLGGHLVAVLVPEA